MVRVYVVKKKYRFEPEEYEEIIFVASSRKRAIAAITEELLSTYAEWRYATFTIERWTINRKCDCDVKIEVLTKEQNKQLVIDAGGTPQ